MRRPGRRAGGDVFGSSLADILTTALGCVLLLFMVAVLNMKKSLYEEQQARETATSQLAKTEERLRQQAEARLEAELARQAEARRRREAEEARLAEERARQEAEDARQTEERLRQKALQTAEAERTVRDLMQKALSKQVDEHDKTLETLNEMHSRLAELQEQLKNTQIELSLSQEYHRKFIETREELTKSRTQYNKLINVAESTIPNLDPRTASPVDIMMIIDGTSSMKPSLDATRRNLKATIGALRVVSPTARMGVVVFRDRKEKEGFRLQSHKLTENEAALGRFLSEIEASSTRRDKDIPEWLCGGIAEGAKARWRKGAIRLMVVVSDADAQSKGAKACVKAAKAFREEGGRVHMISTRPPRLEVSSVKSRYEKTVLPQHEAIAEAGGGIHIRGADSDDLLKVVLRAAFSSRVEGGLDALREAVDKKN